MGKKPRNPKQTITMRMMCDGTLHNERVRKRVIYTRKKDGSRFVRDWQGIQPVLVDDDGTLYYVKHIRTVKRIDPYQFFTSLLNQPTITNPDTSEGANP